MWILIRWLCQKPADPHIQCLKKRINPDVRSQTGSVSKKSDFMIWTSGAMNPDHPDNYLFV